MLHHALAPFDRSRSRSSHRLSVRLKFHHFPPTRLPPACEEFTGLFLSIILVGGGFSLSFAEEIFVYIYYWHILEIKFVTFNGQIFSKLILDSSLTIGLKNVFIWT